MQLTILHTNDLHGRVEQLARIATLAKGIRREVKGLGGHCALWDAGDAEDPTLLESNLTKGSAVMALLRGAGYELAALGNATPLRYGPQAIAGLAARFGRPLLGANMFDPATNQLVAGLEPYALLSFGPLRVGVIGLTAPLSLYSFFTLRLDEPLAILPGLIAEVRARGARIVVCLSHLGSAADKQIAEQVRGLDLIIGAHDHVALESPLVVNGTLIAQAGDYGRYLGRLDLEIDEATGRIGNYRGALLPVGADIPPDADFEGVLEGERARVRELTVRVLGELLEPLEVAFERECAAGNLAADVLLERVKGAEIALTVAGHWRHGLAAGQLSVGALYAAMRSTANPARVELTGAQIVEFLRAALKPENAARQPRPLRGVPVGLPHVAGITAQYDAAAGQPRLRDVRVWGESLVMDRRYIVAGTDLEFSDVLGYLVVPERDIAYEIPTILPEVMEEYILRRSPLSAPARERIRQGRGM